MNSITSLTNLETFSITEKFTYQMAQWNHSKAHSCHGALASRIVGCALVAFTALADAFVHVALALGIGLTSLVVLPFRCCFRFSPDLKISSSVVHLIQTAHSIFHAAILPFVCLLDPDRAYSISRTPSETIVFQGIREKEVQALTQEVTEDNKKIEKLNADINSSKQEEEQFRKEYEELKRSTEEAEQNSIQKKQAQENQIALLKERKKTLENEVKSIRDSLPIQEVQGVQQRVQNEQQVIVDDLNQRIANLNEESTENRNHIQTADQKAQETEREVQSLNHQISLLEQEKLSLNQKIEEKKVQIQDLKTENQQTENNNSILQNKLTNLLKK